MSAKEFADLFSGFTRAHGLYTPAGKNQSGKVKGKAATVTASPLTSEDWERHLRGEAPGIGVVPLRDDSQTVLWGAIDIDDKTIDHVALEKKCKDLPVVISKSKSNGAHVWLFCKEPIAASLVQLKLTEWAIFLGYPGVEIFPKQTSRASDQDIGNWINLPFFGKDRQGVLNGKEIGVEKFIEVAKKSRVATADLMNIDVGPKGLEFQDGPPCLQQIHEMGGFPEGSRNDGMFSVIVYFKRKFPDDWQDHAFNYNRKLQDPLPTLEVTKLIENIAQNDYFYKCQQPPICNFCNRATCLTRVYGVGSDDEDELNVTLSGLTKYESRPPIWVVAVDGKRIQLKSTEDLMQQSRFQRLCIEEMNVFPNTVKKKAWVNLVRTLLDNVESIPVPEDASPSGQFFEYLTEFIRNHLSAEKEDLATGNAWVDDGWAYFRSQVFFDFLKRNGFRDFTSPQMFYMLSNELKAEKGQMNVKGRVFNYWRVKTANLQDEPFDIPSFQENY